MLIVVTAAITRILKRLIHNPRATGIAGGIVHTVASASDGIQFVMTSGNITS